MAIDNLIITEAAPAVAVVEVADNTVSSLAPTDIVVIFTTDVQTDIVTGQTAAKESIPVGIQGPPGPPYVPFNFIRKTEEAGFRYYGFTSGPIWKIKRKAMATGIWTVASGQDDFDTAWSNRAQHDYGYV